MENSSTFLTAAELARVLRVSTGAIYAHVKQRRLPHHRLGDRLLFRLDEVLAATHVVPDGEFENHKVAGDR